MSASGAKSNFSAIANAPQRALVKRKLARHALSFLQPSDAGCIRRPFESTTLGPRSEHFCALILIGPAPRSCGLSFWSEASAAYGPQPAAEGELQPRQNSISRFSPNDVRPHSPNGRAATQVQYEHLLPALGSIADRAGQQAGATLLIVQLLARERLITLADARRLIRLLAPDSPEAQRIITAQCMAQRKVRRDAHRRVMA